MKTFVGFLAFFIVGQAAAQDVSRPGWQIMPGIVFVNYFPGVRVSSPGGSENSFDGVGFQFIARTFHPDFPDVAFNVTGGINWFKNTNQPTYYNPIPVVSTDGVGSTLQYRSFRTFPLTVGVEGIFPRSTERTVMFSAGANAGFHFVDGDLDIGQQAKFGYSLGAGFSVKAFEIGIRYYSFSDMKNLGAHIGVRMNSFPLE